MGRTFSSASMSLDGFIAYDDNSVGALFDWYDAGPEEIGSANPEISFHLTEQSAAHWRRFTSRIGALVVGRTLFDLTDGWGGRHPLGVPVVVLTHQPPTGWNPPGSEHYTFVTEGIEAAVARAKEIAGEADVAVAAGTVARQCLEAGLLDEVAVDLVPMIMGSGRPYFGELTGGRTVLLQDAATVVSADRVLHLVFDVAGAA